jgi:hypothetical protein
MKRPNVASASDSHPVATASSASTFHAIVAAGAPFTVSRIASKPFVIGKRLASHPRHVGKNYTGTLTPHSAISMTIVVFTTSPCPSRLRKITPARNVLKQ